MFFLLEIIVKKNYLLGNYDGDIEFEGGIIPIMSGENTDILYGFDLMAIFEDLDYAKKVLSDLNDYIDRNPNNVFNVSINDKCDVVDGNGVLIDDNQDFIDYCIKWKEEHPYKEKLGRVISYPCDYNLVIREREVIL